LSVAFAVPALASEPADKVFLNGKVFTADAKASVVQAFAVTGDRFVAVGRTSAMRAYVGPKTAVIDLKGRFVSPGLADNHFHGEGGGPGADLSHVRTMAELLTVVANTAAAAPADAIITSNSDWHEAQLKEQRLPTAKELDQASPDKPVVLARGGHSYLLNSVALKKFNITKDTVSPAGGQISRDANGELTGELFDGAKSLVPLPPRPAMTMADILTTQKAVNPYGITALKIPGSYQKGDTVGAYHMMREAEAAGGREVYRDPAF
jgi:predicted amidohydrolase YtcJ